LCEWCKKPLYNHHLFIWCTAPTIIHLARANKPQQQRQEPRRDCETTMDSSVTNGYSRSIHERTCKRKMTLVSFEFRTIIIFTISLQFIHLLASNTWYWHWRPVASLSPPKALQRSSLYHERTQGWACSNMAIFDEPVVNGVANPVCASVLDFNQPTRPCTVVSEVRPWLHDCALNPLVHVATGQRVSIIVHFFAMSQAARSAQQEGFTIFENVGLYSHGSIYLARSLYSTII
jgi:hypothetical protein